MRAMRLQCTRNNVVVPLPYACQSIIHGSIRSIGTIKRVAKCTKPVKCKGVGTGGTGAIYLAMQVDLICRDDFILYRQQTWSPITNPAERTGPKMLLNDMPPTWLIPTLLRLFLM